MKSHVGSDLRPPRRLLRGGNSGGAPPTTAATPSRPRCCRPSKTPEIHVPAEKAIAGLLPPARGRSWAPGWQPGAVDLVTSGAESSATRAGSMRGCVGRGHGATGPTADCAGPAHGGARPPMAAQQARARPKKLGLMGTPELARPRQAQNLILSLASLLL